MAQAQQIQVFDNFAELRKAAPTLEAGLLSNDLFYSVPWFENLAQYGFTPGAELKLLLFAETSVALPLVRNKQQLASLSNYYSSLFGPTGNTTNLQASDWQASLDALANNMGTIDQIDLSPLDQTSPFFAQILLALTRHGYWADSYFCFGNWYAKVEGDSFNTYFQKLPSKLCNTIKRGKKKLTQAGQWKINISLEDNAELHQAINDFTAVYANSWKSPEGHPNFIPSLCHMATKHGWLRLGVLQLDQKPIAAQLWLVCENRAMIYKLAYDEAFTKLSAGSVLTAAMMEHAIDVDHVSEVDYLTGDDAYKRDWMSHRRERLGIVAFNPKSWRGILAAARHFLPKWMKQAKRRVFAQSIRSPNLAQ